VTSETSPLVKRLAVVTSSYPSIDDDAAGHFVRAEVRILLNQGHSVTVFAPSARRDVASNAEEMVEIRHWGAFGSPGALARLRGRPDRWIGSALFMALARQQLFARHDFNEVSAHFILPSYWPIAAGHPKLSRVVIHGSDLGLLERLPSPVRTRVIACLGRDTPVIQCVSQALADRLAALTHRELQACIVVEPAPIELPNLPSRAELRRSLAIDDRSLILVVARLIPSKRVEVALRAALQVPRAQIVVCGGGPLQRSLTRTFPSIRFLGPLPRTQTLRWIAAADVLLSASRTEGAPTAIREARALGVPVITTAAGDLLSWAASDPGLHVVP
jgi:teichuronic acid biosynthesis glycosyltransferase TuaC